MGMIYEDAIKFSKKARAIVINIVNQKIYGQFGQTNLCYGTKFTSEQLLPFVNQILASIARLYANVSKQAMSSQGLTFGDHLACAQVFNKPTQLVCYDLYNQTFINTFIVDPATTNFTMS